MPSAQIKNKLTCVIGTLTGNIIPQEENRDFRYYQTTSVVQ